MRFFGIISTVILVRILEPDDFGVIAQAMIVIMLFEALSQTGYWQYIVRLKEVSDNQLFSAWCLNIILRSIVFTFTAIFAVDIANFMGEPRLEYVLYLCIVIIIVEAMNSPGMPLLNRDFKYKEQTLLRVLAKLVSFISTIFLAYSLKNYWALIIGSLVNVMVFCVGSYIVAPKWPKICLLHIKEQWLFTRGLFVTSVLGYLRSKSDLFVISHKFGTASTGHYSVAQEFSQLPYTEIISPIMGPLYASFAKLENNNGSIEEKIQQYISLVYLFIFPSVVGIAFLAEEIVLILLGEPWLSSAPVLANLSFLMIVFGTNSTLKQAFILKGKFSSIIAIDIAGLLLIISTLFISFIGSMESFSLYRAGVGVSVILLTFISAKYILNYKLFPFFMASIVPTISSLVMLLIMDYSVQYFADSNIYIYTIALALIGGGAYSSLSALLLYFLRNRHSIWHFNFTLIKTIFSIVSSKITKRNS